MYNLLEPLLAGLLESEIELPVVLAEGLHFTRKALTAARWGGSIANAFKEWSDISSTFEDHLPPTEGEELYLLILGERLLDAIVGSRGQNVTSLAQRLSVVTRTILTAYDKQLDTISAGFIATYGYLLGQEAQRKWPIVARVATTALNGKTTDVISIDRVYDFLAGKLYDKLPGYQAAIEAVGITPGEWSVLVDLFNHADFTSDWKRMIDDPITQGYASIVSTLRSHSFLGFFTSGASSLAGAATKVISTNTKGSGMGITLGHMYRSNLLDTPTSLPDTPRPITKEMTSFYSVANTLSQGWVYDQAVKTFVPPFASKVPERDEKGNKRINEGALDVHKLIANQTRSFVAKQAGRLTGLLLSD